MLAILARVLMLVACVPLLQPTGFCICKVDWSSRTPPAQERAEAEVPSRLTALKSEYCTQRCGSDDGNQSPTPRLPERSCPSPADDNHMPGCPASMGADRFKWVEPAGRFAQTLPPVETGTFLPFELVVPVAVRPIPSSAHAPSSPPFYLSHCSLVI